MHVFLSGPQASWAEQLQDQHLLVSYAEKQQLRLLDGAIGAKSWLVDSGAFTTWRQGRPVDLNAYIAFLQGLEARAKAGELKLAGYLALDCIPGEPGRMPTPGEAELATTISLQNLDAMLAAGLKPWPVYHEGEPLTILDAYVAAGHEVIALGATASRGKASLSNWLAPIFERHPGQRFHGLAMTQGRLLRSFPFHSVDSTSWLNLCRYGTAANLYLLRGRSRSFWAALGFDLPPFDIPAAAAHLEAQGKGALLRAGALALQDTWTSPPGSPVTLEGQMLIASALALGGMPKGLRQGRAVGSPSKAIPLRTVPGQLPLFLAILRRMWGGTDAA